jgi:hypothetical protein
MRRGRSSIPEVCQSHGRTRTLMGAADRAVRWNLRLRARAAAARSGHLESSALVPGRVTERHYRERDDKAR